MARSMIGSSVGVTNEANAEPRVKAKKLRELAAWYRAFAARAANPAIWEARLLTADDLDAEASRIDPPRLGSAPGPQDAANGRT